MTDIPVVREVWCPSHRIVPSRFPTINVYERVADPADLEAVFAIEALTNPRLREEAGELGRVPPDERISGPGTSPIMASFTHLNPQGSRFSDGTYGVFYTGRTLETAIRETVYHRERFMRDSAEPPMELDMRIYLCNLEADMHDIRGLREAHAEWYHPQDYRDSQALGRSLRAQGSWGILYQSVRHAGGECAAVFRPKVLSPCRQGQHLGYLWNGSRITGVIEKRVVEIPL